MTETGFMRHVRACNNVRLPGPRLPFGIGRDRVGWVSPAAAAALGRFPAIHGAPDGITLTDPGALPEIARALSEAGWFPWRQEAFDVRATPDGPSLARLDRGALPTFGVQAVGVHVNGLVRRPDGMHLWIARRAQNRALDPGKLDQIVAGGVPAGLDPQQTLIKEAGEEASIPPTLAAQADQVASLHYTMERAEGLRRDWLCCYDLLLPTEFKPIAADGEVEAFELWPIQRVVETVRATNDFKFNVNLVLIDLFIRLGLIARAEAEPLRTALTSGQCPGSDVRHD